MFLMKPYFLYRPQQIFRRVARIFQSPEPCEIMLPWGIPIHIDPREAIGNAIWRTGLYEIATAETIYRLLPTGGTAIDVGANIGYITGLMVVAAGKGGNVLAFEPHPEVFESLRYNVELAQNSRNELAHIRMYNVGLSNCTGKSTMVLQDPVTGVHFNENRGVARIGEADDALGIEVKTLDSIVNSSHINLMKIDVEGHELPLYQTKTEQA